MTSEPDPQRLESVALGVATEWDLELGEPFALSQYSYVVPAGEGAVLKVRPVDDTESDHEAEALELWNGDGAARLIRRGRGGRALLIERARPGIDISTLPDDRATEIAIDVALRLWQPAVEPFQWVGDHVPRWLSNAGRSQPTRKGLIAVARRLYESLDPGRSTIVHGDLHHHNILDAGGRFVAIDPKPMIGEPEFDVASFLWNPIDYRMTIEGTEQRLAAFANAGLDEWRMRAWCVIRGAYLRSEGHEMEVIRALV